MVVIGIIERTSLVFAKIFVSNVMKGLEVIAVQLEAETPPDFKYNFPALALPAKPIPIVLSSTETDNVPELPVLPLVIVKLL